jgi:hypothetical protein
MMSDIKDIILKKLMIKLINKRERRDSEASEKMENTHQQVNMTLSLEQLTKRQKYRSSKPASDESLGEFAALGIKLDRALSMAEANHLLDLSQPPSNRQLEILKHFKIKNRSEITRVQAYFLIQSIFSDPTKIEQWKQRPPTSMVKQGILFMGGQLNNNMTQIEAKTKLLHFGMENPHRFLEWRQIENLFLSVNDADTLEQHNARKITWKRFFQIYDALKSSGAEPNSINAEIIHQHMKQIELAQKRSLSGQLLARQQSMSNSGFQVSP